MTSQCANPVCDMPRATKHLRCGGCRMYRWRYGVERPERLTRPVPMVCTADGCRHRLKARGLCAMHYERVTRIARRARLAAAG